MADTDSRTARAPWLIAAAVLVVLGAAGGFWWQSRATGPAAATEAQLAAAGIGPGERAAIEALVRDYILTHPEILPEAMERLQAKGAAERVAADRPAIEAPFPGAVLGNPKGAVTLVEFTDYACGFCRQSVADVRALVDAHPDLRIVIRELPILSNASHEAARMALAAARQGRYATFHDAMFAGGRPDPTSIAAAARGAGVDLAAATAFARGAEAEAELSKNLALATKLGITGTPAWVVGDRLLVGAVGRDALEQAIVEARKAG
ncbi:MAG: DsbA family protein [Novosphingobium sp.]